MVSPLYTDCESHLECIHQENECVFRSPQMVKHESINASIFEIMTLYVIFVIFKPANSPQERRTQPRQVKTRHDPFSCLRMQGQTAACTFSSSHPIHLPAILLPSLSSMFNVPSCESALPTSRTTIPALHASVCHSVRR